MDGRQKPDPQPENDNDLNDEEIIDLIRVVEGGDDDNIIDLNDILDQPAQVLDAADEPEEAIMPLVDAIPAEKGPNLPEDADDDIIDLTEVTTHLQTPAVEPIAESASAPSDDEAVIDLLDVATTLESDLAEVAVSASPSEETAGMSDDADDVIDLLDVATTLESDLAEVAVSASPPEEAAGTSDDADDVIDLLDVAATLEPHIDEPQPPAPAFEETAGAMEADEPIIDLLDTLEPQTAEAETTVNADNELADLKTRADAILTDTSAVFDFETPEEAAETASPDDDFMVLDDEEIIGAPIIPEPATRAEQAETPVDAALPAEESVGSAMFMPVTSIETTAANEPVPLTEQQVEDALQRVIEKIYGAKIEHLLIQTIEKTVTREIAKIKNALLEEDDGMAG